jgi:uncharacterized protein YoxC
MIPLLGRYVGRLEEHNRLLIEAATESARKLQEREAELMQAVVEMSERVARVEQHNRLLTDAATESARKLQEREAELTQAVAVMSQRVVRLSEHNRWLTESAIDAVRGAESTVVSEIFVHRIMQQLQEIDHKLQ